MYQFKSKEWTWEKFDKVKSMAGKDVCIVLKSLCCVDVDDAGVAAELESRFPCLQTAPKETTRRGVHWFFSRPASADDAGYFDGAAQRAPHVDFKSVSRTGTSGIVVVSPSENKAWVRPLYDLDGPAPPIPDDLLAAIAKARHVTGPVRFVFGDGTADALFPGGVRFLRDIAFFEPTLEQRWAAGAASSDGAPAAAADTLTLTVPPTESRAVFLELLHVLQTGELSLSTPPTRELFESLIALANFLLVNPYAIKCLRDSPVNRPREQADLFSICPAFSAAEASEGASRRARASGDELLVPVDAALAAALVFSPLEKDARFLFPKITCAKLPPGARVLTADPPAALRARAPAAVLAILTAYRDHTVLAGGSVTAIAGAAEGVPFSDYDIFLYSLPLDEANAIVDAVEAAHAATHFIWRSRFSVTFTPKAVVESRAEIDVSAPETAIFQLVLNLCASPHEGARDRAPKYS
jgi:hypothetical protein